MPKRTGNPNINFRRYWNGIYGTTESREGYEHNTFGPSGTSKRFATALTYVKPADTVLDIGCGVGMFTKMVKDAHPKADVWGTDISDLAMVENTRLHPGITYHQQYIGDQFLVPHEHFDVVFAGEVLEHLEIPQDLFKDAHRVLKKGGVFVLTTPLENRIDSPEHLWSFTHDDITKLYEDHGFAKPTFEYLPESEHMLVIFAAGTKL